MPDYDKLAAQFGASADAGDKYDQLAAKFTSPSAARVPDSSSFMDKLTGGIEAARSLATNATTGALGTIGGTLGSVAAQIVNGDLGTQQGLRRAQEVTQETVGDANKYLTYQPKTAKGIEYTNNVAKLMEDSGIAGLPIGGELNALGSLAKPAAQQAKGAIATDAYAVKQLANKVADANFLPKVSPETATLADKARQFGIQLTPDMLSSNKFARIAGETAAKVPLSGAKNEPNQIAFNRSLIKMIGGEDTAKTLTPEVYDAALSKAGQKIGDIATKTAVPMDEQFTSALAGNLDDAAKYQTEDVARVVNSYVDELQNKAANDGSVNGQAFRTLHSKIGRQIRGTTNGDLKQALGDIQESMMDALQRNIADPADMSALLDARKKYAIAKTIEPLVAKSTGGDISPAGLMQRVTSDNSGKTRMATGQGGDLGDLARVGQRFLKEPASSNTGERSLVYGMLGGGAVLQPGTAAGIYAGANAYNRLSPLLANKIIDNSLPKKVPPVAFDLSLKDESPFAPRPQQAVPQEYNGLLSLASEGDAANSISGLLKDADPAKALRAQASSVPDTERLATRHDVPTIDFPLRQEVLQQPEISSAINAFRTEAQRLETISKNAINPKVAAKAADDLAKLQSEFAAGMRQLGIDTPADAHGLNRPLYETGTGTRLPIKTTERKR